jgi:thymidylate kinase
MTIPSLIVVTGPDGAGKTTIAAAIVRGDARATGPLHWRPEVLPRLGALVGRKGGDPSDPHANPQRGRLVSMIVLIYYWLDFFIGTWLKIRPVLRRGDSVVMERGWYDFAVDPKRYRLDVSPRLVILLGHLLRPPDVVIVLDASEQTLLRRKQELPVEEIVRQRHAWLHFRFPRSTKKFVMDAEMPETAVVQAVRRALEGENRRVWAQRGWVALPTRKRARWYLPRRRCSVAQAFLIYQPVTPVGRGAWTIGRFIARTGGSWILPHDAPPDDVMRKLEDVVGSQTDVAVARTNREARWVALVMGNEGHPEAFAKLALSTGTTAALAREAEAVRKIQKLLSGSVYVPRIRGQSPGMLLFDAVEWRPRNAPWRLPTEVAYALGRIFTTTADVSGGKGAAHGDFAPWNLLQTARGWALIDWEDYREDFPPFFDIFHFFVQSHLDLHIPSKHAILDGIRLRGPLGRSVTAYAEGASIDPSRAAESFADYLRVSSERLDPAIPDHLPGLRVRRRLARMLHP